jgi:hypothetical protein
MKKYPSITRKDPTIKKKGIKIRGTTNLNVRKTPFGPAFWTLEKRFPLALRKDFPKTSQPG